MNKWKIFNHTHLRNKLLQRFAALKDTPANSIIFLQGGHQQTREFVDTDIPFRQESHFFYVTGVQDPDCAAALNLQTKEFCLFVPHLDDNHALWCGGFPSNDEYKQLTGADTVAYTDDIEKVIVEKWQSKKVFTLKKLPKSIEHLSKQFESIDSHILYTEITQCRLRKEASEIETMAKVGKISAEAHVNIMRNCKANMYEYQLESLFTSYTSAQGCKYLAYPSIVAGDDRGATLHYVNNDKLVKDGSLLLVDAGAELNNYASDITRTYPINGKFTQQQREIYEIVLKANKAVIELMKPGVSWVAMHRLAERIIAEGLLSLGLLKGSIEEILANHVQAVFFPHGLGHSLGLDVHDPPNRDGSFKAIEEPGIRFLRIHADLEEGMVLTVEPGIYFNELMITNALADEKLSKYLVKEKIDQYKLFGGIRIEDNVLVTSTGTRVFTTDVPKEIADIEKIMAK